MATAERRIDGCVAYTSLVRYDAWGEMSGPPVEHDGAARRPPHRRGGLVDPPPRPGARLREAGARGRVGARAVARGAAGHRGRDGRRARRPRADAGRLPRPAGTYSEEALRASAPAGVEEVPYPTIYEAVMAVQDGDVDRAVVPIENALEGAVAVTLDTLALRGRPRAHRGRGGPPDPPLRRGGARARAGRRHARGLPSPGHRPVRALPARAAAARRAGASRPPRPTRCCPSATRPSPPVALGSRLAAELYGCRVLEADVEDHPDNATRFVWLARPRGA